jgi:hypothetical protein
MLSLYLAFLYTDKAYYNQFTNRILCMSTFLFDVQQKNRLSQKGLLKRFSITCYGHQESIEEMKSEKAKKYKEFKQSNNKKMFEEWFLNYKPDDKQTKPASNKKKKSKRKVNSKNKNKSKKIKVFNPYNNNSKTRKNKNY